MKRKIRDIMNEMDELENVEVSDEFIEKMREIYKDEIEEDVCKDNEKVASGINLVVHNGKISDGLQDRL